MTTIVPTSMPHKARISLALIVLFLTGRKRKGSPHIVHLGRALAVDDYTRHSSVLKDALAHLQRTLINETYIRGGAQYPVYLASLSGSPDQIADALEAAINGHFERLERLANRRPTQA